MSRSALRRLARRLYYAIPSSRLRAKLINLGSLPFRRMIVRKDLGGYSAELHLREVMEFAAFLGSFERDMVGHIEALAKPGMTVLDIGANVGLHALRLARSVSPNGQVFAFEPSDYAYRKLARNVELNPHLSVRPIRLALSNEDSQNVEVHFRSSWLPDGGRADLVSSRVDFGRLDTWVEQQSLDKVDLIKIDVDGFEGFVISGGRETIGRHRPAILIEASIDQSKDGRPDPFAELEALGYRFIATESGEPMLAADIRQRLDHLTEKDSFNVLARHEARTGRDPTASHTFRQPAEDLRRA